MTDLFSAGFAWDDTDVSQTRATPVATASAAAVTRENVGYPNNSTVPVAGVADVAETEGQRLERLLSQNGVAVTATADATAETADCRAFRGGDRQGVAPIAGVADWPAGIAMLNERHAPVGSDPREWRKLVRDARSLASLWSSDLQKLGWSAADVFGVERNPAHRRLNRLGLVTFINGGVIEAVNADSACILHGGKDRLTYRRGQRAAGSVPIWEITPAYLASSVGVGRGEVGGCAPALTPRLPPRQQAVGGPGPGISEEREGATGWRR